MSENMTIFQNPEFGNIRTMRDEKGEPLFCAKDVCDALGYKRVSDAISGRVEEEDTVKCRTLTNGGAQLILFHQRVRSLPKHLTCERMMSQNATP